MSATPPTEEEMSPAPTAKAPPIGGISYLQGAADNTTIAAKAQAAGMPPAKTIFVFPGNTGHHDATGHANGGLKGAKGGAGLGKASAGWGAAGYPTLSIPTTLMAQHQSADSAKSDKYAKAAMQDLYKAVGAGYHLVLPVRPKGGRVPVTNSSGQALNVNGGVYDPKAKPHVNKKLKEPAEYYFSKESDGKAPIDGLAGAGGLEPSFWGGVEAAPNHGLAQHYIEELDKLQDFILTVQSQQDLQAKVDGGDASAQAELDKVNAEVAAFQKDNPDLWQAYQEGVANSHLPDPLAPSAPQQQQAAASEEAAKEKAAKDKAAEQQQANEVGEELAAQQKITQEQMQAIFAKLADDPSIEGFEDSISKPEAFAPADAKPGPEGEKPKYESKDGTQECHFKVKTEGGASLPMSMKLKADGSGSITIKPSDWPKKDPNMDANAKAAADAKAKDMLKGMFKTMVGTNGWRKNHIATNPPEPNGVPKEYEHLAIEAFREVCNEQGVSATLDVNGQRAVSPEAPTQQAGGATITGSTEAPEPEGPTAEEVYQQVKADYQAELERLLGEQPSGVSSIEYEAMHQKALEHALDKYQDGTGLDDMAYLGSPEQKVVADALAKHDIKAEGFQSLPSALQARANLMPQQYQKSLLAAQSAYKAALEKGLKAEMAKPDKHGKLNMADIDACRQAAMAAAEAEFKALESSEPPEPDALRAFAEHVNHPSFIAQADSELPQRYQDKIASAEQVAYEAMTLAYQQAMEEETAKVKPDVALGKLQAGKGELVAELNAKKAQMKAIGAKGTPPLDTAKIQQKVGSVKFAPQAAKAIASGVSVKAQQAALAAFHQAAGFEGPSKFDAAALQKVSPAQNAVTLAAQLAFKMNIAIEAQKYQDVKWLESQGKGGYKKPSPKEIAEHAIDVALDSAIEAYKAQVGRELTSEDLVGLQAAIDPLTVSEAAKSIPGASKIMDGKVEEKLQEKVSKIQSSINVSQVKGQVKSTMVSLLKSKLANAQRTIDQINEIRASKDREPVTMQYDEIVQIAQQAQAALVAEMAEMAKDLTAEEMQTLKAELSSEMVDELKQQLIDPAAPDPQLEIACKDIEQGSLVEDLQDKMQELAAEKQQQAVPATPTAQQHH